MSYVNSISDQGSFGNNKKQEVLKPCGIAILYNHKDKIQHWKVKEYTVNCPQVVYCLVTM